MLEHFAVMKLNSKLCPKIKSLSQSQPKELYP
jgi:hypothetical protein